MTCLLSNLEDLGEIHIYIAKERLFNKLIIFFFFFSKPLKKCIHIEATVDEEVKKQKTDELSEVRFNVSNDIEDIMNSTEFQTRILNQLKEFGTVTLRNVITTESDDMKSKASISSGVTCPQEKPLGDVCVNITSSSSQNQSLSVIIPPMSLTAPSYEPISPCEPSEGDTRKVVLCDHCVVTTITTMTGEQSITINQDPLSSGKALCTHATVVNTNRATVVPLTSHNTTWSSYVTKNISSETKKLFPIFYRPGLTQDKTLGQNQNNSQTTVLITSIPTVNAPSHMIPSTVPFTLPSNIMPHSTVANTVSNVETYTTHHDYPIAGTSTSPNHPQSHLIFHRVKILSTIHNLFTPYLGRPPPIPRAHLYHIIHRLIYLGTPPITIPS